MKNGDDPDDENELWTIIEWKFAIGLDPIRENGVLWIKG
jgi:hypothetical protein